MSTAVPKPTITDTGFTPPEEIDVVAGVTADMNAAFGGNMNPDPATPQGQLSTAIAAMLGHCNSVFLQFINLVDPARSRGRMQDAIGRIYFIERIPAKPTLVTAQCTGLTGVTIPAGAVALDDSGNRYIALQSAQIGVGGVVDVPFAAETPGPTPCPSGSLARIYQAIPGWDAITNAADGALGNAVESPAQFEARRALSVAKNSLGCLPSVLGAVLSVEGVTDAFVTENDTGSPRVMVGVTIPGHSIYVAVLGGDADAVARAIWSRKSTGCTYHGDTTIIVEDDSDGYMPPYPSYEVKFQRPTNLPVAFLVVLAANAQMPANAATLIRNAVIDAAAGIDGGERVRIGRPARAGRYYSPIGALGSWAQVVSILIGSPNAPAAKFVGAISGTTLTVTDMTNGAISVGSFICGGTTAGTRVVAQTSGAPGLAGAYTLSVEQTVPPGVLTAVEPKDFEVSVNIDQVASISADMILVDVQ